MTDTPRGLADRVVAAFRDNLNPETRDKITVSEYHTLSLIVREALSDSVTGVLEQFEETAKRIQASAEQPSLDL